MESEILFNTLTMAAVMLIGVAMIYFGEARATKTRPQEEQQLKPQS